MGQVVGGLFFDLGPFGPSLETTTLRHFSAMTRPCWLRRAVRNRHRHAIEQASRRWRGGRREDSARTRRKILISTQVVLEPWEWPPNALSAFAARAARSTHPAG